PDHGLRILVTDRAGSDLETVADRVVLVGLERERFGAIEGVEPALRHGEGVVGEIQALFFLAPLVEGEIDDPAQLELLGIDQIKVEAGLVPGFPGELVEFFRPAADEEHRVPVIEAKLSANGGGALLADILGDGAGPLPVLEKDITKARLAFALRPRVHAIAEGARATGRGRDGPDLDLRIGVDLAGKDLEAGAA